MRAILCATSAWLIMAAVPAAAQIAISANDSKQDPATPESRDSITVLDLSAQPVRQIASLDVPTSMIGPPASVALTPDGRWALVTASQKRAGEELEPDDTVTIVDLSDPSQPKAVETLHAGGSVSGVAISPDGTMALTANKTDNSITVFSIGADGVTRGTDIGLDEGSLPVDLAFSADGTAAYVVANGAGKLIHLDIDGGTVTPSGKTIATGSGPYSISINDDAGIAYVTNLNGRGGAPRGTPAMGTLSIIDLSAMRELEQVDVGNTPEFVAVSPDGKYLQTSLINGSNAKPDAPGYNDHGYLKVFAIEGQTLRQVAEAETGKWCQGGVWSSDQKTIVLQCADQRELDIYAFDGDALTHNAGETIQLSARPGAIATPLDR